ncbi:MAG: ATP-binding protein, partial [Eggerthellaceae bacterium]|nr:ATP-binding protein [Eggerthellaceae bacterium]
MREGRSIEFKESMSKTFLKTVSAFSNYGGGSIYFGVNDDGEIVGLDDPDAACLDIENRINDSISPQPDYSLVVHKADSVVELMVREGRAKPYLYRAKAYRRNDSATIEVDQLEMMRLVLEGRNLAYEQLPAKTQDLSFETLAAAFGERV